MPRSRIVFRHSHSQFRFHFASYPLFLSFSRLRSSRPTFHFIFHSFILLNFLATSQPLPLSRPPIEIVYSEQQSVGFVATSFLVSRFDDLSRDARGAKPRFLLLHGVQHRTTATTQPTRYVVNNKGDPMCREWAWIETHGPFLSRCWISDDIASQIPNRSRSLESRATFSLVLQAVTASERVASINVAQFEVETYRR